LHPQAARSGPGSLRFATLSARIAALALGLSTLPAQTAAYQTVTNTRRTVTNFNVETIRGMAFDAPHGRMYAINTHKSALVYFTNAAGTAPAAVFRTINNPSALALYDDPLSSARCAIVVGGGTHGVVKQNRDNGEIRNAWRSWSTRSHRWSPRQGPDRARCFLRRETSGV
jgi:hypothetical protein